MKFVALPTLVIHSYIPTNTGNLARYPPSNFKIIPWSQILPDNPQIESF